MKELNEKAEKGLEKLKQSGKLHEMELDIDNRIDGLFAQEQSTDREIPVIPITRTRNWYALAASFLFFALAAYFLIPKAPSNEKLFSSYLDAFPDVSSETVRGEDVVHNSLGQAMQFYNNGSFEEAIKAFEKIPVTAELKDYANFYQGISLLNTGNAEKALSLLSTVQQENGVQDGVEWYTALAHLKLDDVASAKKVLESISSSKHYKKKEALQLLEKLK